MSVGFTAAWWSRRSRTSRWCPGEEVAELLGNAEEIVNRVAPEAVAEARAEDARREARQGRRWWRRRR